MQMKIAYFRFYAELNDFLPLVKRQKTFTYPFSLNPSIKDAIEACGVPHPEIDVILVNTDSVDYSYRLKNGDRVAIYPVFESFDVSPLIRLRAKPLRKTRFIMDENLGKLARKLRMLGFDTIYERVQNKQKFIRKALDEKRIILTRSSSLLRYKVISHGYWVRSTETKDQIKEIISRFDLYSQILPFKRCLACNGQISSVPKSAVANALPQKIDTYYTEFWQCDRCHNIYWKGSHYKKMVAQIGTIVTAKSG